MRSRRPGAGIRPRAHGRSRTRRSRHGYSTSASRGSGRRGSGCRSRCPGAERISRRQTTKQGWGGPEASAAFDLPGPLLLTGASVSLFSATKFISVVFPQQTLRVRSASDSSRRAATGGRPCAAPTHAFLGGAAQTWGQLQFPQGPWPVFNLDPHPTATVQSPGRRSTQSHLCPKLPPCPLPAVSGLAWACPRPSVQLTSEQPEGSGQSALYVEPFTSGTKGVKRQLRSPC